VSNRSTKIQASILVDAAGVPIPGGGSAIGSPEVPTFTQNLALAPLNFVDAVVSAKIPRFFSLRFSAALAGVQTLTVTYESAGGAAFNTNLLTEVLPIGTQDKIFFFPCSAGPIRAGDHYRIQLTNTGAPAITVSGNMNYTV
jgi:hypothetical protein